MRFLIVAALVVFISGCSKRGEPNSARPQSSANAVPEPKKPQFTFVAPGAFEWNDKQRIWYSKSTRTSISIAHEPGKSFQAVVNDFVADRMLNANMELLKKEVSEIDGRATLLVHGNRLNARYPQQFSAVAYGTSTGCAQLTAIYPTETAETLKAQIEHALLTSRYGIPD